MVTNSLLFHCAGGTTLQALCAFQCCSDVRLKIQYVMPFCWILTDCRPAQTLQEVVTNFTKTVPSSCKAAGFIRHSPFCRGSYSQRREGGGAVTNLRAREDSHVGRNVLRCLFA